MLSTPPPDSRHNDDYLDSVFSALGDRTRRGILLKLADGPAKISDLAVPFDMSLPAVSKHLRVLERAGLVRRQIEGRVHYCSLLPEPLHDAQSWVALYRRFWQDTLTSLSDHLEKDHRK